MQLRKLRGRPSVSKSPDRPSCKALANFRAAAKGSSIASTQSLLAPRPYRLRARIPATADHRTPHRNTAPSILSAGMSLLRLAARELSRGQLIAPAACAQLACCCGSGRILGTALHHCGSAACSVAAVSPRMLPDARQYSAASIVTCSSRSCQYVALQPS